jgi:hypothetical protein
LAGRRRKGNPALCDMPARTLRLLFCVNCPGFVAKIPASFP